jgi:hypothetical protein
MPRLTQVRRCQRSCAQTSLIPRPPKNGEKMASVRERTRARTRRWNARFRGDGTFLNGVAIGQPGMAISQKQARSQFPHDLAFRRID